MLSYHACRSRDIKEKGKKRKRKKNKKHIKTNLFQSCTLRVTFSFSFRLLIKLNRGSMDCSGAFVDLYNDFSKKSTSRYV